MSDENRNTEPPARGYDVGYGKPPKKHQFKPGESGNKRGRPPKSSNMRSIIIKIINSRITIKEDGKRIKVTAKEAAFLGLQMDALKGRVSAQRQYFDLIAKYAPEELEAATEDMKLSADNREILNRYLKRHLAMSSGKEVSDEN